MSAQATHSTVPSYASVPSQKQPGQRESGLPRDRSWVPQAGSLRTLLFPSFQNTFPSFILWRGRSFQVRRVKIYCGKGHRHPKVPLQRAQRCHLTVGSLIASVFTASSVKWVQNNVSWLMMSCYKWHSQ